MSSNNADAEIMEKALSEMTTEDMISQLRSEAKLKLLMSQELPPTQRFILVRDYDIKMAAAKALENNETLVACVKDFASYCLSQASDCRPNSTLNLLYERAEKILTSTEAKQ